MRCPKCGRDAADRRFCQFCSTSVIRADHRMGGIFARLVAAIIDGSVFWAWLVVSIVLLGTDAAILGLVLLIGGFAGWLFLLNGGITPGKAALGLRVVRTDGEPPGLVTMLVRDMFGKYVSGFIFGLGWLWAVFDRDRQTWHDKVAGTVVVRRIAGPV